MEHSKSVRTILKHSLNVISNAILLTGILLMVGAVGSMDIAVETGASGAIDLKTMLIGLALTLIGFTLVHRGQVDGNRSISTQKWIRKLTLQAWINEHSDTSYLGKHENQVL